MRNLPGKKCKRAFLCLAAACLGGILFVSCAPKPAPGLTPAPSPVASPTVPATPFTTPSVSPIATATPSTTAVWAPTLTPSPSLRPTATPKASPTVKPTARPSPTATPRPVQLSEKDVLSILKIREARLVDIQYVDLDGDGVKDAIVLYREEPVSDGYAFKLTVSAVNSATKKHQDIALPFDIGLLSDSMKLTVFPVKNGSRTTVYAVAGGKYGGTVGHVGFSVLQYAKSGWKDIFQRYRDNGMGYALTMQNGPKAILTLETGKRFVLIPTDLATYRASGWIDENGNLTSDARVFEEHIGFAALTYGVDNGALTLYGTQEIRGLHKLDVLALLNTVWRYDGTDWSITANVEPLASTVQSE